MFVAQAAGPTLIAVGDWPGRASTLHANASGKVLLAFLAEREVLRIVRRGLPRYTDRTITELEPLLEEIARARRRGGSSHRRSERRRPAWRPRGPRSPAHRRRRPGLPTFLSSHPATEERRAAILAAMGSSIQEQEDEKREQARPRGPVGAGGPASEGPQGGILALGEGADIDALERSLAGYQQRFESDPAKEEELWAAFASFRNARPDAEAVLRRWTQKMPRSYSASLALGVFYLWHGIQARGAADVQLTVPIEGDPRDVHQGLVEGGHVTLYDVTDRQGRHADRGFVASFGRPARRDHDVLEHQGNAMQGDVHRPVLTLGEARPLQNVGSLTAAAMLVSALVTYVLIPALARKHRYRPQAYLPPVPLTRSR